MRLEPSHDRPPAPAAPVSDSGRRRGAKILRFHSSERWMHWALAVPFVILYASAVAIVLFGNEPPPRHLRNLFGWIHRAAGVGLIALPPMALLAGIADWRTHLANIREAWSWDLDDVRWLILMPRAAADPRIELPEQGKFNAAEKLNFMTLTATYPLYILTGILVWLPGVAFFAWVGHVAMAVLGLPLVAGHIFMATINPSTRIGLAGMFTGWVDREWAKHHYRKWYRRHFEHEPAREAGLRSVPVLGRPAAIRCGSCKELQVFESWEGLLQRALQVEPLYCSRCHHEIGKISLEIDDQLSAAILAHLDRGRCDEPFEQESLAA